MAIGVFLIRDCLSVPYLIRETFLGCHGAFMGKKPKKVLMVVPLCVFLSLWKGRNWRSLQSKVRPGAQIHVFCNPLLQVRRYLDGDSMSMIDFIDLLGGYVRGAFGFLLPLLFFLFFFLFCLPLGILSIHLEYIVTLY